MSEPTYRYASVVVDVPTRALSEPFDYEIPQSLADVVGIGVPVLVPLGATQAIGYVVALSADTQIELVKQIDRVLGNPLFNANAIDLARWISSEYLTPLSEALRLFLPPGGTPRLVRGYVARGPRPDGDAGRIFDLASRDGGLEDRHLGRPGSEERAVAARLCASGSLERTYRLEPARVGAVSERFIALTVDGASYTPSRAATMQRAVIGSLADGPVSVAELRAELGAVDGAIRRLETLGVVHVFERERLRAPEGAARHAPRHEALSLGQRDALKTIGDLQGTGGVVLLDGVTGSGKTEVYLRAIEDCVSGGGRAIVLVPEISLTPQTVGRFRSRFGERVAVLHSRLSDGERYDQWRLALSGRVDVVVGARSALFAPLPDIKLIVIDEEHEASYKQSSSPRYHARAVAERLASSLGAVVVLGSATPSMESHHAVEQGRYSRVRLPERVGGGTPPKVEIVDMGAEFQDGHRSMFSRPLLDALERTLEAREKAVLFLNRRGYASFLLCRECGFVPECQSCAVSMTYHEHGDILMCHHCGARAQVPVVCPRCGSAFLRRFGAGTQRVEEEIRAHFPNVDIVRMDADTTTGKGGHEKALLAFEALDSGILLGTQMVAKGLDYPEVTLVGVINADTTMHLPDFRSAERTYQLLEQVAGRAGRGERPGTVVVQTYWPDHPAVAAVERRDPEALYLEERVSRSELGYPPYGRLANIVATSRSIDAVREAMRTLASQLEEVLPDGWSILGPAPAPIAKLKERHRWHVLLKAPADAALAPVIAAVLARTPGSRDVVVTCDIDPVDLV